MSAYSAFNLALASFLVPASALLIRSRRQLRACVVATTLSVLVGYPWNSFAIASRVWASLDPGPRLYAVPLNDVAFLALCTLFTSAVLTWDPADSRPKRW